VGEIYGDDHLSYSKLLDASEHLKSIMREESMVVDVDDMAEANHEKYSFVIDKEKAALHGISAQVVTGTLRGVLEGNKDATLHLPDERQPLQIRVTIPRKEKSSITSLKSIPLKSADGRMIPLAELAEVKKIKNLQPIYHKNLDRVVYTLSEAAGRAPGTAVIDMMGRLKNNPVPEGTRVEWAGEGEWKITLRVFRDMGIGFAAAMMGIYILLVIQSGSFFMPVIIMMAIPLTLLGIMPGFLLLNTVAAPPSGGFPNPIFFTATSMIGMIALGGIVIRNSLVLIEFIQDSLERGEAMKEAILKSGAIRMRPIVLTALTTGIGAFPITFDPVFSGLAWALIFGLLASTFFTLIVIPVTYFAVYGKKGLEQ
jgi:multidrug efflux pump subunit AcrB